MTTCVTCGEPMCGRPTSLGRCGDCHRAHMRETEPWQPAATTHEGMAAESEAWRAQLQEAWEWSELGIDT